MKKTQDAFSDIKKFLVENADAIQKLATLHHKEFLGGKRFRSEVIKKYQSNHIKVVRELAKNLETADIKKGSKEFKELGETLAKDSVKDSLTIEEATDGIIFLKQAVWRELEEKGFLKRLTTEEFYKITQTTGTYVDIVVSKIAFTYHMYYSKIKDAQEKQKDEFIGLATHELKTPITSVKAFAQVLENRFTKSGDKDSARLLAKMGAQLTKVTGLIADLLDVSRLETGKLQFQEKSFDFNELIEEIVEEIQHTDEKHQIIKKFDDTKTLYGDRDRIGQVIVNLLTNAIKYSPKADKIIVETRTNGHVVTLGVQDFGFGIPKNAQKKVFDQFYRVMGKDSETFPGMGLGLYISAEIIRRHKGKIWVESQKSKGSTFYFSLPVKRLSK
jgi:signal transduction histidine kinase